MLEITAMVTDKTALHVAYVDDYNGKLCSLSK